MAFLAQLRQALRGFLKSPGFTATAVLTLALGIGANVAIFSVLDAVLFRPLPYPPPDRLVALDESNPARAEHLMPVAVPDLLEWRDKARCFEGMAAYRGRDFVLTGRGEPERVRAALSTAGLLELLGATPILGRTYTRDEETPGRHRV